MFDYYLSLNLISGCGGSPLGIESYLRDQRTAQFPYMWSGVGCAEDPSFCPQAALAARKDQEAALVV